MDWAPAIRRGLLSFVDARNYASPSKSLKKQVNKWGYTQSIYKVVMEYLYLSETHFIVQIRLDLPQETHQGI